MALQTLNRVLAALLGAAALLAGAPPAAQADPKPHTVRYGPIELGPYEVGRGDAVFNIPKPTVDGFITAMEARLVYGDGREVPIANTMLHHVVMADLGRYVGEHQDATCTRFRMFDSQSYLPLTGHRFFGLGEERAKVLLPPGYGYPTKAADRWAMTYMLMNHLRKKETVFVEYTMQIEQERQLQPITPIWLDVRDCNLDPVFDVPGGGKRGSKFATSTVWTAPRAGRIVFGLGHMHGGGDNLTLSRPDCGDQPVYVSKPLWGKSTHPYYQVKPLLHEPGPISMTTLQSEQGIPVAAGERLELTATYDGERPHTRAMGIMVIAFVPDGRVTSKCAPLPGDTKLFWSEKEGRKRTPRVTVPITGYNARIARAQAIAKPPGDTVALRSGSVVDVADFQFSPANVQLRRGGSLRWRFFDQELHNVTLANGPRGFSSDNLNGGREFAYTFKRPGTYRMFCTLHPVAMATTVRVAGSR